MATVQGIDARAGNAHTGLWKQQQQQQQHATSDITELPDECSSSVSSSSALSNHSRTHLLSMVSRIAASLIAASADRSELNCQLQCQRQRQRQRQRQQHREGSLSSLPQPSPKMLLQSLPRDVLANDVLGFLTDKTVKTFLDSLGPKHLESDFSELRTRFCAKHGSLLEDPRTFRDANYSDNCNAQTPAPCCPECYAEDHGTKRCHGCLVFYPRYTPAFTANNSDNDNDNDPTSVTQSGPGLWCQSCDRLAFCNSCLSNDTDGCGSVPPLSATGSLSAFGAFGRKRLLRSEHPNHHLGNDSNDHEQNHDRMHYCTKARITCHNYCCPNVFTNTMCGEFVCDDCGDEHQRRLRQKHKNNNKNYNHNHNTNDAQNDGDEDHQQMAMSIHTCDECGKATCLDPNCLVCADFRLIHMSCSFVPEDAYRYLFWGKGNETETTCRAESSTKLRRIVSDLVVWTAVVAALLEMWWFGKHR